MQFETQKLIIELLNQELKKANRIPTLAYHKEIQDAKKDFITYMIKNCSISVFSRGMINFLFLTKLNSCVLGSTVNE